jgi:hypothetical protein
MVSMESFCEQRNEKDILAISSLFVKPGLLVGNQGKAANASEENGVHSAGFTGVQVFEWGW